MSAAAAAAAKSLQWCLTLCDPIDGSPPGFPVPGILKSLLPWKTHIYDVGIKSALLYQQVILLILWETSTQKFYYVSK